MGYQKLMSVCHGLRDLSENVSVFGAALQILLDLVTPPDTEEDLGLTVAPGELGAIS